MLEVALATGGIVISNDKFREHFHFKKYFPLEKSICGFMFAYDQFIITNKPLGQWFVFIFAFYHFY